MKKPYIIKLMMILSSIVLYTIDTDAQASEKSNPSVGKFIFGGPNIGFLRGTVYSNLDEDSYQQPKIGYTLGVGITRRLSDRFEFSTMIMLEEKGTVLHKSVNARKFEGNITYRNYTIAFVPNYRFGKRRAFGVGAGPFLSYLSKETIDQLLYPPPVTQQIDYTKHNYDLEFGMSIQVYYQLKLKNRFSMDLKLLNQLGLTNTKKNSAFGVEKTNATSFLLGFTYQINK